MKTLAIHLPDNVYRELAEYAGEEARVAVFAALVLVGAVCSEDEREEAEGAVREANTKLSGGLPAKED